MVVCMKYSVAILCIVFALAGLQARDSQSASASGQASDESSGRSLAEIAKDSQKQKTAHAKKLITTEDIDAKHGPLPRLSLGDEDNADEIVQAIGDFHSKHTNEETEQVVHDWYDEYDTMLAAVARENTKITQLRAESSYNGYWGCQDSPSYETCVWRHRAEMRGSHDDEEEKRGNFFVVGRIQQSFMKIRTGIMRYNLQYPWFKIRNGNGIGSY